jgi:hypothetical protein
VVWFGVREVPAMRGGRHEVVSEDLRTGERRLLAIRESREDAEAVARMFRLSHQVDLALKRKRPRSKSRLA